MTAPRRTRQHAPAPAAVDGARRRLSVDSGAQRRPKVSKVVSADEKAATGLTEAAFQRQVVTGLKARGYIVWTVPNMRLTTRGLPDVLAIHPLKPGRLLAFELKTSTGRVRPEQAVALACLATVRGVDARVVRPKDWRRLSEEV